VGFEVLTVVVMQSPVFWDITMLVTCFKLVSFLAYSSTLMMEVTGSFETSIDFSGSHGIMAQTIGLLIHLEK
jgi:hypothetical protein